MKPGSAHRPGISSNVGSAVLLALIVLSGSVLHSQSTRHNVAATPPMGWNSWNCFGIDVREEQVRAVADYMATHLKHHGWEYVVIDMGWYGGPDYNTQTFKSHHPEVYIDAYGRLIPSTDRFPSARDGNGFRTLADYVHSKGLKFGIHIMRGLPWKAVEQNTPILGSVNRARDIAAMTDTCEWYHGTYGVNMTRPGAQEYYDSLIALYADWGVDFVKADDMSRPYHADEIEGLSDAMRRSGRPMVLSLSPGDSPVQSARHLSRHADMWRISNDFWDDWRLLKHQFTLCRNWQDRRVEGTWPDCDMLPIGKLRITGPDNYVTKELNKTAAEITNEYSRLTPDEHYTLMTLWCVFRSPLMIGGYVPENTPFHLALLTNDEVLRVNQAGRNNREILNRDNLIVWGAEGPETGERFIAVFNLSDADMNGLALNLGELGFSESQHVRDLWERRDIGNGLSTLSVDIKAHGTRLLRMTPGKI